MKEVYNELNYYLNEICNYLQRENSFLLENIYKIARINDEYLVHIRDYELNNKVSQNNLSFSDVYYLAREIIENIDKNYLERFDNLIKSGELDFSYDNGYYGSHYRPILNKGEVKQIININREFNYNDVVVLVHEFIHYTNGKKYSINGEYLSEFLSIYFELYAVDYLLEKGINKEEIDILDRIKNTKIQSMSLCKYEIVLLAFIKFGNLDDSTVSLLQQYFLPIEKEIFEKECINLNKKLNIIVKKYKDKIEENPKMIGYLLSEEFITYNYKYVLGTLLAIYARKYSDFNEIINLNNHINEYDNKSIYDICLGINIDLKSKDFVKNLFNAVDEYISNKIANITNTY